MPTSYGFFITTDPGGRIQDYQTICLPDGRRAYVRVEAFPGVGCEKALHLCGPLLTGEQLMNTHEL